MYRIWYSSESFADFIINYTDLSNLTHDKKLLYESDIRSPNNFHKMPDHIRKILYLDCPDLIIEKDNEPVFAIEVSTESGTGHNAFQRFARIAAAVENNVPIFYIYPEQKIITRNSDNSIRYDKLNPIVLNAMESLMSIYSVPALLYYFPSDDIREDPRTSPYFGTQGLIFDPNIALYSGCPNSTSQSMQHMFLAINEIIRTTEQLGVIPAKSGLLRNLLIREHRDYMNLEYARKLENRDRDAISPLSAVITIPTEYLLNYLAQYENYDYSIGELLRNRPQTCLYKVNATFRGDPYPGSLAAIDYLKCRQGSTFEDRRNNLVMVWGEIEVDDENHTINILDNGKSTITDFISNVQRSSRYNLLTRSYEELSNKDKPRYFMQVRYGSTYSKQKHIRIYSYFADAILFPDGSLWRDA